MDLDQTSDFRSDTILSKPISEHYGGEVKIQHWVIVYSGAHLYDARKCCKTSHGILLGACCKTQSLVFQIFCAKCQAQSYYECLFCEYREYMSSWSPLWDARRSIFNAAHVVYSTALSQAKGKVDVSEAGLNMDGLQDSHIDILLKLRAHRWSAVLVHYQAHRHLDSYVFCVSTERVCSPIERLWLC